MVLVMLKKCLFTYCLSLQGIILTLSSPTPAVNVRWTWREFIMGIVHGNWLTGTHSGRANRRSNVYTRVNKKTGVCYSAELCNPNLYRNEMQKKNNAAFGIVSAAVALWISTEKAKPSLSEDYKKVKMAFDRQTRYSTLRGLMIAKGMYKLENGQVVVDVNANSSLACITPSIQLPSGGSCNTPSAPAEKFTVTLTASPSNGGSVTGAGQYAKGSQVTIKAVANSGYTFTKWSDNDTNAQRTLTISGDVTLQAIFTANSGNEGGSGSEGGSSVPGGGYE